MKCRSCRAEARLGSHYCRQCSEDKLAAFVRADRVRIPAGADNRPVRRVEAQR